MNLSQLKLHDRNPRTMTEAAFDKLKASIQRDPEFMRLRPIVYAADGTILGGNMRYRALQALGHTEIPDGWAVCADSLTPEQQRRFVLVDNAPEGMAGEWDMDMLAADYDVAELIPLGFELPVPADPPAPGGGGDGGGDGKCICPNCGKEH